MPWWAIVCFILDGITITLGVSLIIWYFTKGKDI